MKTLLFLVLLMLGILSVSAADYGKKVSFSKGAALVFPDCDLTFTGTRTVASPVYPRGFLFYDFAVKSGGKTGTVSWTSGTGEIGPQVFELNGKRFVLELGASKAFQGWLKQDQLVLWQVAQYEKVKRP